MKKIDMAKQVMQEVYLIRIGSGSKMEEFIDRNAQKRNHTVYFKIGHSMKLTRTLRVKNRLGLHARPATYIAKLLQPCSSSVSFITERETVNAKSVLGILMLAATQNTKIQVSIEGEDAEHTMELITHAFETKFGEG